jgi:hypothetical protein
MTEDRGSGVDDRVNWVQLRLAAVSAGCAAAMVVCGLAFKTTRSVINPDGSSQSFSDGVKPCVGRAVMGGLMILLLLAVGWWFERSLVAAPALVIFMWAGRGAAAYRDRLETTFQNDAIYAEQSLALGLRTVPELATLGAVVAGLPVITEVLRIVNRRRNSSPGRAGVPT